MALVLRFANQCRVPSNKRIVGELTDRPAFAVVVVALLILRSQRPLILGCPLRAALVRVAARGKAALRPLAWLTIATDLQISVLVVIEFEA